MGAVCRWQPARYSPYGLLGAALRGSNWAPGCKQLGLKGPGRQATFCARWPQVCAWSHGHGHEHPGFPCLLCPMQGPPIEKASQQHQSDNAMPPRVA